MTLRDQTLRISVTGIYIVTDEVLKHQSKRLISWKKLRRRRVTL